MTKPVCNLGIDIQDDGTVWLSAADWSAEGHLWAIERRPVSIAQLRAVAEALGPDAQSGVEARLRGNRERLRAQVARKQAVLSQLEDAESALEQMDAALGADAR
jgi:hypothetical protein